MKRATLILAALALLLSGVGQVKADFIYTYTLSTEASGTLDGACLGFPQPGNIVFTVTYDASDVSNGSGGSYVNNLSAYVTAGGITDEITPPTYTLIIHDEDAGVGGFTFSGVLYFLADPRWLTNYLDNPTDVGDYATVLDMTLPTANGSLVLSGNPQFPFGVAAEFEVVDKVVTPEPSTLTLLGIGAVGLLGYGWRRRKPAAA